MTKNDSLIVRCCKANPTILKLRKIQGRYAGIHYSYVTEQDVVWRLADIINLYKVEGWERLFFETFSSFDRFRKVEGCKNEMSGRAINILCSAIRLSGADKFPGYHVPGKFFRN